MSRFTDPFTRANGAIGPNYTLGFGFAVNVVVNSNQLLLSNSSDSWFLVTGESFGNDQEIEVTIVSGLASGTDYAEIGARGSGLNSTFSGYGAYTDGASGAGHTEIVRYVGGESEILKTVATTFTSGDKIKVRVVDSNPVVISLYKNGVFVDSFSDSSGDRIQSGGSIFVGGYSDGGLRIDDLDGGDVAGDGTPADAEGAGVTDAATAPAGAASVGVTASGAGVEGEATAPDATAESITVRITGYRLINKVGAPVEDLSDIPGLIYRSVPSEATAPDKQVLCSTNGSGVLADIDISDIQSDGSDVWLVLMLDGSPARGTVVKVTPTVID